MTVSVSTPRFEAPSVHSLTTVPSRAPSPPMQPFAPPTIVIPPAVSPDLSRLMQYLQDLDQIRGGETQDLKEALKRVEDELKNLSNFLRKAPTPTQDRSIGVRTPMSMMPQELAPRDLSIRSLSPPPMLPMSSVPSSSMSDAMSYLSSHHSDDDLSDWSYESYPRDMNLPSPRTPTTVLSMPTSPPTSATPDFSSPESVSTVRPTSPPTSFTPLSIPSTLESAQSRGLGDLRDLLHGIQEQAGALWDGQISTNHMLDDLMQRRIPEPDMSECNERLRRIESLLDNILGGMGEEPSESGSDTSSVLRRLISSFRDPSRYQPPGLHVPTPVRAPPASYDPEWMEFLNAPPAASDQPVQGPPPLPSLTRRSARIPRSGTASPPSISPPPRTHSAPLDDRVRFDDLPPPRGRDVRGRPWIRPRLGRGVRPPETPSELDSYYDGGVGGWRQFPRARPVSGGDINFDDEARRLRALRHPDSAHDGFFNASRPTRQVRCI